jgi:hypothetical protein
MILVRSIDSSCSICQFDLIFFPLQIIDSFDDIS